jgi:hypothetical protein
MDFPKKRIIHGSRDSWKWRQKVPSKGWDQLIQTRSENGILNYTAANTSKPAQAQKISTEFIEIRYRIRSIQ